MFKKLYITIAFLFCSAMVFGQRHDSVGNKKDITPYKGGISACTYFQLPNGFYPLTFDSCRMLWVTSGRIYFHDCLGQVQLLSMKDSNLIKSWGTGSGGSGAVISVNGHTGVVSLTTSDVPEGGNLYFTDARVYADTGVFLAYVKSLPRDYTNGFGLIFSAGRVIKVDTGLLASWAYRKKGDDSIAAWVLANFLSSYTETDPVANTKTVTIGSGWGTTGGGIAQALSINPSRIIGVDSFLVTSRNRLQKLVDSIDATIAALTYVTSVSAGYGTNFTTITGTGSVKIDSYVIATKTRLYKVRDSIIAIGYLTTESDPIAIAKTATITNGFGVTGGGSAQTVGSDPAWTLGVDTTKLSTWQYRRKGTDSVAALIPASLNPTAVKNSNYTMAANELVPADASSGSFTVTLPTAPADKTIAAVKVVSVTGTYSVTITTGGSDVFNIAGGSTSGTLKLLNQGLLLQYKASSAIWYVIADDLSLGQLDSRYVTTYTSQTANYFFSAPNGSAGLPVFRAIVPADIPTLNQNTSGTASNVTGTVAVANGGTGATTQTSVNGAVFAYGTNNTVTVNVDVATGTQTVTAASYSVSCTPTTTITATSAVLFFEITAQATALLFNAPTGTWANGEKLWVKLRDNGSARALTYNSAYVDGTTVTRPTTTTAGKGMSLLWIYNSNTSKFELHAYADGFP